jgi:ferredoxin-type protein NapG
VERRDFLKTGIVFAGGLAILGGASLVSTAPRVHPPGIIKDSKFFALCNRCGRCLDACPTRGLSTVSILDLLKAGTPQLTGYCRVFDEIVGPLDPAWNSQWKSAGGNGTPCNLCVFSCPTGALESLDIRSARLGMAELNRETCLAWRNGTCNRCYDVCPVNAVVEAVLFQPVVETTLCIGCNQCGVVCPTNPKSIWVNPVELK